jgi:hypothetical protein
MTAFCTACGKRREGAEQVCTKCSTPFDDVPVRIETPPATYGPAWYIALSLVLAALVVGAVLGGRLLFHGGDSSADPGDSSVTLAPETTYTEQPTYPETETTYTEDTPTSTEDTPTYTEEPTETITSEPVTPEVSLGNSTVAISETAATNPAAAAVVALLTSYFTAINDHDYAAYKKVHTKALRSDMTEAEFTKGYRSTQDSEIVITDLGTGPDGRLMASVTFISTQDAADGRDQQGCTKWTVGKFLQREGSAYRIGQGLKGFADHSSC